MKNVLEGFKKYEHNNHITPPTQTVNEIIIKLKQEPDNTFGSSTNIERNKSQLKQIAGTQETNELSEKLKQEQDLIFSLAANIEENEARLKQIVGNDLSFQYLHQPFKFIMGFLHTLIGAFMLVGVSITLFKEGTWGLDDVIVPCIYVIIVVILEAITKKITTIKLKASTRKLEKKLHQSVAKLNPLLDKLSLEIHHIGLFHISSIKAQTSARLLSLSFIKNMIIDKEIEAGKIEKIQLKTQTVYKSHSFNTKPLLLEIHQLGLFSLDDAIRKTAAGSIHPEYAEFLIKLEVKAKNIEKIQLKTQAMYQSHSFNTKPLLLEIHQLGLFSLDDMLKKTAVGFIHPEYAEFLIELEVKAKNIEKIQLTTQAMYQSHSFNTKPLLLEIHQLGLFSLGDVIRKTAAGSIHPKYAEFLIELEVKAKNIEKIQLKTQTVYKSHSFNTKPLLLEIHQLGLFSLDDVIRKTAAGSIHPEYAEFLIELEVKAKNIEKIQLTTQAMYQSHSFNTKPLLLEIHQLGLFSLGDVIRKTAAGSIHPEYAEFLIELEVKAKNIEKIEFKEQKSKKTQTLYRSLIAKENGDDDMEHIELQID